MNIRVISFIPVENQIIYSGYGQKEFGLVKTVEGTAKEKDGSIV